MSHGLADVAASILLIEADPFLRRLMTLGLQQYGLQVTATSSPGALLDLETSRPDLLVLDVDTWSRSDWDVLVAVQAQPHTASLPIVMLAWDSHVPASVSSVAPPALTAASSQLAILDKPFDARALYRAIKHLLTQKAQQKLEMEAMVEATYARHTMPSVWPVITAASLFLVVIGMLMQPVVAIVGLVMAIVALLIWTGRNRARPAMVASGLSKP